MPDSGQQGDAVAYLRSALRAYYRTRPAVAVESDMFLHYRPPPGAPPPLGHAARTGYASIAPDCLVSHRAGHRRRLSYVVGAEPLPDFVLEVASQSTGGRDYGIKRAIYESLGIAEYFIFDARERPADPCRLLGLRLASGSYREIEPQPMPGGSEGVFSEVLGLHAYAKDCLELRLCDPATGADLRTLEESEQRADQEACGRREAELRADGEAQRRREAELHAAEETRRRREAERRLAEMAAELARLRGGE